MWTSKQTELQRGNSVKATFSVRSAIACLMAMTWVATLSVPAEAVATEFNLETATIEDINKAFDAGALTAEKLESSIDTSRVRKKRTGSGKVFDVSLWNLSHSRLKLKRAY